jgi:hypothetical protein
MPAHDALGRKLITVSKTCTWCNKPAEVTVTEFDYKRWRSGTHAQHAFAEMSADDREMLISGTPPACWDEMFSDTESEDCDNEQET